MKRKILLILSISFALLSCSDFLEEIPRHQWEVSVAVSSYAGAEQAVNGIYAAALLSDDLNGKLNLAYATDPVLPKKMQQNIILLTRPLWSGILTLRGIIYIKESTLPI